MVCRQYRDTNILELDYAVAAAWIDGLAVGKGKKSGITGACMARAGEMEGVCQKSRRNCSNLAVADCTTGL